MSKILLQNRKVIIILILVASLLPGCLGMLLLTRDLWSVMHITTRTENQSGDPQVKVLRDALERMNSSANSSGN